MIGIMQQTVPALHWVGASILPFKKRARICSLIGKEMNGWIRYYET